MDENKLEEELSSKQGSHYNAEATAPLAGREESSFAGDTDETEFHGSPSAEPPPVFTGIQLEPREKVAGGIPAIMSSLNHIRGEMGMWRGISTLSKINQKDGFDCPGCAWPDPDGHRSIVEFCENGAKAVAEEATEKRITPEFFREWPVAELSRKSDFWLGKQGRLTCPMVLREGASNYEPLSWDQAFDLIAHELNSLNSPDEAIFYTSGRTSNEAAFLYQLFVRQFGTNNLPDCSNMCHESSGSALTETIGVGKGTVTLDDFNKAEVIVIIGQNPGTCHPRMLTSLLEAKRNGCRIVHINPLPETGLNRFKHPQEVLHLLGNGTELTDLFLQVKINGDVALLKGIGKQLLSSEADQPGSVLDSGFIRDFTAGFEGYRKHTESIAWQDIEEQSGINRKRIAEAADILAHSNATIFCWAMGLTQHKNAVANIQEIVNLVLLRGQIGKPGAGVCPVRGHSNVQGDRTMGIWERPTDTFLNSLAREFDFEPPRVPGFDTVDSIKAMKSGRASVFIAMGGNFLSATPDTELTASALSNCRLTVHVSTKLNRSHLISGKTALILPCLGRTEVDVQNGGRQFVSMENSMGVVHRSEGKLKPASQDLLSEPMIIARMAQATLAKKSRIDWLELAGNYDRIRDHISRVVPGCRDYNEQVRRPGGFYLPNGARERKFKTENGRANFTVHDLPGTRLESGQFLMMTIRSHDQFNTTIYGLDDRYRGIKSERRVVLLNKEDIDQFGFRDGQVVDLTSHFMGEERRARRFIVVPYSIPRQCAATYFPETNVLVPIGSVAEKSNTPASKSVVITISPSVESGAFDYDSAG
jgi:molybdopterin-dependent oxidoreductase alpha subunit